MNISGEAEVSSEIWQGDQGGIDNARLVIKTGVLQAISDIGRDRASYKELCDMTDRVAGKIADILRDSNFEVAYVKIAGIAPSESAAKRIGEMDRLKAAASMSPEELAKKAMEAQKAAEEALAKLTPEQKAKAEAEAREMARKFEQEHNATMEQVRSILNSSAKPESGSSTRPVSDPSANSALNQSAYSSSNAFPKFCPNCGTPNKGTKFCPNCGNKF